MGFLLVGAVLLPAHTLLLPVVEHPLFAIVEQHECLSRIGIAGIHGRVPALAEVADTEQGSLLACFGIVESALLCVLIHQFLAPPGQEQILWAQAMVVLAAEVQVFEREEFLGFGRMTD